MEKTIYLNFKKLTVTGSTKQEALNQAPFTIMGDATQAFRNWKKKQTTITDASTKEFMMEYLKKKSKNVPGGGFYITVESAVVDTRERPYKFTDVKNEKGKRKYSKVYTLKDRDTNEILAKCDETKAKAKDVAKELYKNGYKGKIICTYSKEVSEGEPVAFYAEYAPSVNTKPGEYIVFGIEA